MRQDRPRAAFPGCARRFPGWLLGCALLLLVGAAPARAGELLAQLQGRWVAEGQASFRMDWSLTAEGFDLRWTVPGDGEVEAAFARSDRPNVFASAGGWSMLGGRDPVNPLVGGTLRWARTAADAVYVYSLAIDDGGGFVLDRYACRPAGGRLEVAFSRRLPEGRVEELALTLARAEG